MGTTTRQEHLEVPTRLGRLHVRAVGEGEPVVLWHSLFVDSTLWDRMLPLLPGRRLLLVDAPSHGRSEPLAAATDIAGCADAAVDLLDGLSAYVDGPVDWLGNAWGGHVGIHLAGTRPERIRRLVSVSAPTFPVGPDIRRKIAALVPLYRLVGVRGAVATAVAETLLTDRTRASDPEAVERVLGPFRTADRRGMALAIRTAVLHRVDLADELAAVGCPTLFVATDDRGEWSPDEAGAAAQGNPVVRVATVQGSRVLPMLERPEALAALVADFWATT